MMQAAIYGRLGQDPRQIDTRSGKAMAVASVAVDVADSRERESSENPEPLWVGIVAFGGQADRLLRQSKGDTVSVSGRVQRNRWRDRDGNDREQLQVVADVIISAKTVRPSGKKKSNDTDNGKTAVSETANAGERDFDDDIPF